MRYLTEKLQKELVEGILLSQVRYGLEITTGRNDRENKMMQRLQSRAARLCLGWKRKDWSLTRGLEALGWLSTKCAPNGKIPFCPIRF